MKPLTMTTPSEKVVCVTRQFDALPELVWRTFTEPELVKRWLTGPPGHTMPVCEIDLRVGGSWKYVWKMPDDTLMTAYGKYQEVKLHERIVHTETFEQWPDNSSFVTTRFNAQQGGTQVTTLMEFDSETTRDMVLQTGMTEGMEMSYQGLDQLLIEQRSLI